jgi:transposase-like protein
MKREVATTPESGTLAAWIRAYGVTRLARELGLHRQTPYQWLRFAAGQEPSSNTSPPQLKHARAIIQLAAGAISLDDFFPPGEATR